MINVKKTHLKRAAAFLLTALMAGSALAGCGGSAPDGLGNITEGSVEEYLQADTAAF